MELDVTIHKGSGDKPIVIFIHGLAVDKNFWIDPYDTKVLGKSVPMRVFASTRPGPKPPQRTQQFTIGTIPGKIMNLWLLLKEQNFNLLCWSQRRPAGPIHSSVDELDSIMKLSGRIFPGKHVVFVCHSRGGLVARKFMEKKRRRVKALVTIATPHQGSSLSLISKHLSPLAGFLRGVLPDETHGSLAEVVKKTAELLQGKALKELMPGSDFIRNLNDRPYGNVKYLSFGGRKTALLTFYRWKKHDEKMCPVPVLTIPDSLTNFLPASVIPDEIIPCKGDFMVTTKSSVLPWAAAHYNVSANHISITWSRKVKTSVLDLLGKI